MAGAFIGSALKEVHGFKIRVDEEGMFHACRGSDVYATKTSMAALLKQVKDLYAPPQVAIRAIVDKGRNGFNAVMVTGLARSGRIEADGVSSWYQLYLYDDAVLGQLQELSIERENLDKREIELKRGLTIITTDLVREKLAEAAVVPKAGK